MRAVFLLLAAACLALAVEIPAMMKHITDGDTLVVTLAGGSEAKVRLLYIDTPESKGNAHGEAMPEGKAATAFLAELLAVPAEDVHRAAARTISRRSVLGLWACDVGNYLTSYEINAVCLVSHQELNWAKSPEEQIAARRPLPRIGYDAAGNHVAMTREITWMSGAVHVVRMASAMKPPGRVCSCWIPQTRW